MIRFKQNLPKYFYFILCCLLGINTAFAVKPISDPTQKAATINLETLVDSPFSKGILNDPTSSGKELVITNLEDEGLTSTIKEGKSIKVLTKDGKKFRGKLKIMDDEHISIRGQAIALKNIKKIKAKRFYKAGIIVTALSALMLIGFYLGANNTDRDLHPTRALRYLFRFFWSLPMFLTGIILFFIRKNFSGRRWSFSIKDKKSGGS